MSRLREILTHECECTDAPQFSIHGKCRKCKGRAPIRYNECPETPKTSHRKRAVRRQFAKHGKQ